MSRRHLGGLAAAALVGAALAAIPHGAVAAATGSGQSARALAAQSARQLIASKAPALKISAHDAFRAQPVVSSHGIQYAPYERTYRGLPVVGGDFVVVSDAHGQILDHLRRPDPQGRPAVRRRRRLARSDRGPDGPAPGARTPRPAPGPTSSSGSTAPRSRLGWETRVTGHQGASRRSRTSSSTPATARSCRPGAGGRRHRQLRRGTAATRSRSRPRTRARRTR